MKEQEKARGYFKCTLLTDKIRRGQSDTSTGEGCCRHTTPEMPTCNESNISTVMHPALDTGRVKPLSLYHPTSL